MQASDCCAPACHAAVVCAVPAAKRAVQEIAAQSSELLVKLTLSGIVKLRAVGQPSADHKAQLPAEDKVSCLLSTQLSQDSWQKHSHLLR